jgi:LuxR family maltose regulon positive regulatory protein
VCLFDGSSPEEHAAVLRSFAAGQIEESPSLASAAAVGQLFTGQLTAARRTIQHAADSHEQRHPSRLFAAARPLIQAAAGTRGIENMSADAALAYKLAERPGPLRASCSLLRGISAYLGGFDTPARTFLKDAVEESLHQLPVIELIAHTQLAVIASDDGDRDEEEDHLGSALGWLETRGMATHPYSALTHAATARQLSRRRIYDEARTRLERALRLLDETGDCMPWYQVETRLLAAGVCLAMLDAPRARELLGDCSRIARRHEPSARLLAAVDSVWDELMDAASGSLVGARSLTVAELRILRFLPSHLSFREIGQRLNVSANTVKTQAHAVYLKLDVSSRSDAVARAAAFGLIEPAIV